MARVAVPARTRWRILVRDSFACRYCGRSPREHGVALEVDHVESVAAGGGNEDENLVTACDDCNRGKHDQPLGFVIPKQRALATVAMAALSAAQIHSEHVTKSNLVDILLLGGRVDADNVLDIVLNAGSWPDAKRELTALIAGRHASRVN